MTVKTQQDATARSLRFKDWYAASRDSHNEKRRNKYHSDPVVKEAARERARAYRKARSEGHAVERLTLVVIKGKPVRLYTVGEVSDAVGCRPQTIRNWEVSGVIPRSRYYRGRRRLYSKTQLGLMIALHARLHDKGNAQAQREAVLEKFWTEARRAQW